jgi:hypothetical protein
MPGLPDRPDLDQLRRQARELLRAAAAGEPHAAGRLHAVSPRATLAAAQLVLAREYGFPNWAALKAEVARRRLSATPADRWSFGGAAALGTPAGVLLPEILIAGAGHAVLHGTLTMSGDGPAEGAASRRRRPAAAALLAWLDPRSRNTRAVRARRTEVDAAMARMRALLAGVTVTDDRGAGYALRGGGSFGILGAPDRSVRMRVQPVPGPGLAWIELRGQDGTTTRLLRSPRASARPGLPGPAAAAARIGPPGPPPPDDGPRLYRDIGIALPAVDGVRIHLDSLISRPGSWQLYLRARPRWRGGNRTGQRGGDPVSVRADDDRGGSYLGSYARGAAMPSETERAGERLIEQEELALRFLPRLDPLARALRLTFRGADEEMTTDLEIGPAA